VRMRLELRIVSVDESDSLVTMMRTKQGVDCRMCIIVGRISSLGKEIGLYFIRCVPGENMHADLA
jgi:hypothetical protein